MLSYALYKLRQYVKKLKAKNVFPNESLLVVILIAEMTVFLGYMLQVTDDAWLLPCETLAQ